jgi:fumarate reductase flavoprotein subunit
MQSMAPAYDVIVIGAGTAGIPTALFAAARGATVLLIDAADRIGGTLHLSSASISAAGAERQRTRGIVDSAERHFQDCLRINHGTGDLEKLRLWTENAAATVDWLFENGLAMGPDQPELNWSHEYYDVARTFTPPRGGLDCIDVLLPLLQAEIDRGRIDLRLNTRMRALRTTPDGAVEGALTINVDGVEQVFVGRNTILACGGYNFSETFWGVLHVRPRRTYAYPQSMGEGLTAARRLGAYVNYTDDFLPTFGGTVDIDNPNTYWVHTRVGPARRAPWEISLNLNGTRFMAEDNPSPDARERALAAQPDMAFWSVYDSAIQRDAPPLFLWPREKIERAFASHPDFRVANSVEELATACGLPPGAVALSVARYNAGQAVGSDEFGRKHMPAPLVEGPFFAVKHYGCCVVSPAGLATDDNFRVLREDGEPIPNLYAAGEILGMGIFGYAFLGGAMVSSAMTFGRLLGDRILAW